MIHMFCKYVYACENTCCSDSIILHICQILLKIKIIRVFTNKLPHLSICNLALHVKQSFSIVAQASYWQPPISPAAEDARKERKYRKNFAVAVFVQWIY